MHLRYRFFAAACVAATSLLSGCIAVSVVTTTAAVAGTAVSMGISAGSMAVGAATTVAKGAVAVGGAIVGDDEDD